MITEAMTHPHILIKMFLSQRYTVLTKTAIKHILYLQQWHTYQNTWDGMIWALICLIRALISQGLLLQTFTTACVHFAMHLVKPVLAWWAVFSEQLNGWYPSFPSSAWKYFYASAVCFFTFCIYGLGGLIQGSDSWVCLRAQASHWLTDYTTTIGYSKKINPHTHAHNVIHNVKIGLGKRQLLDEKQKFCFSSSKTSEPLEAA